MVLRRDEKGGDNSEEEVVGLSRHPLLLPGRYERERRSCKGCQAACNSLAMGSFFANFFWHLC